MDMDFADILFHQQERRPSRRLDDESLIADDSADEAHRVGAFAGTLRETSSGERHDA